MLRGRAMASLDINSKQRMNSGYEIPILGYGVSLIDETLSLRNVMLIILIGLPNVRLG